MFNKNWVPHARAYFTAEILGVLDQIHPALFDALHVARRNIMNEQALQQFFIENGVSEADFKETYHSFAVDTKTRQAMGRDPRLRHYRGPIAGHQRPLLDFGTTGRRFRKHAKGDRVSRR